MLMWSEITTTMITTVTIVDETFIVCFIITMIMMIVMVMIMIITIATTNNVKPEENLHIACAMIYISIIRNIRHILMERHSIVLPQLSCYSITSFMTFMFIHATIVKF